MSKSANVWPQCVLKGVLIEMPRRGRTGAGAQHPDRQLVPSATEDVDEDAFEIAFLLCGLLNLYLHSLPFHVLSVNRRTS